MKRKIYGLKNEFRYCLYINPYITYINVTGCDRNPVKIFIAMNSII
ncbi:MAG: hypothetical protein M1479_01105 [Actinobacteria bacterium]|nr:hypothetical protein [Cyanobacteriota bacterium]MCL5770861.1 hypothetical protein [Actinomycetota bacterium]